MGTESDTSLVLHNLGMRIRMLREEQRMSQVTLSLMVSISRGYLNGVERGRRNPSVKELTRISRGLGVPLAALVDGIDASGRSAGPSHRHDIRP